MASEQCVLSPCPKSLYGYRPNLGINIFFTIIFGLVTIWVIGVAAWKHRWVTYSVAIALGAVVELAGYISRGLSWDDPTNVNYFSVQFTLLTLAPVFLTAGIYFSLRYIATTLGKGYFNINTKFYTAFFIPSDIIALIVQAVGGGLATSESTSANPPSSDGLLIGTKITIAGLALQVASLAAFLILFLAVVLTPRERSHAAEVKTTPTSASDTIDTDPTSATAKYVTRAPLAVFMLTLMLATTLIIIRSCYRVAELSQGLSSSLATNQWLFVGLDGFMVAIATLLMAIAHPALILPA